MLEPIDEKDLDLKNKFLGGVKKNANIEMEKKSAEPVLKNSPEVVSVKAERKEGTMEKDDAYNKIISKIKNPASVVHSDVSSDAKMASDEIDYESKVNNLVRLAENKGIAHAVKVARHMEDNYLLDELHDQLLAQDLHDALVKKGMITSF